jgi:hypothetical protein
MRRCGGSGGGRGGRRRRASQRLAITLSLNAGSISVCLHCLGLLDTAPLRPPVLRSTHRRIRLLCTGINLVPGLGIALYFSCSHLALTTTLSSSIAACAARA